MLYTGQDKLESSSIKSLEYVTSEADETSDSLRKVSQLLVSAKQTNVVQVSLPPILQTDIDQLQTTINSAATMLTAKTQQNSQHFNKLIHSVYVHPSLIDPSITTYLTISVNAVECTQEIGSYHNHCRYAAPHASWIWYLSLLYIYIFHLLINFFNLQLSHATMHFFSFSCLSVFYARHDISCIHVCKGVET